MTVQCHLLVDYLSFNCKKIFTKRYFICYLKKTRFDILSNVISFGWWKHTPKYFFIMWHTVILNWILIIFFLLKQFPDMTCILINNVFEVFVKSSESDMSKSALWHFKWSVNQLFSKSELIQKNESYIWMNCRLYPQWPCLRQSLCLLFLHVCGSMRLRDKDRAKEWKRARVVILLSSGRCLCWFPKAPDIFMSLAGKMLLFTVYVLGISCHGNAFGALMKLMKAGLPHEMSECAANISWGFRMMICLCKCLPLCQLVYFVNP